MRKGIFGVVFASIAIILFTACDSDEQERQVALQGTLQMWDQQHNDPVYGLDEATQEAWLATVQKRLATGEYRIAAAGEGFRAANRAQGLRFFAAGADFTLEPREGGVPAVALRTLRLSQGGSSVAMDGPESTIGKCMDASRLGGDGECVRRLDRRSDGIAEWFDNRESGIEQGFDIARPLSGKEGAPITVEMQVVAGSARAEAGKVTLLSGDRAVASLHSLFVLDAKGERREGTITVVGDRILLTVATAGLSYPITIDPIYSGTADRILESNQASAVLGEVASAGDVNGDGYSDVIVGAPMYDSWYGAVFIYHGSATGVSATYALMLGSGQDNSFFGTSVASAGDVNGDGYGDIIVGTPHYDNGQADEGVAFVYHGSASGIVTPYAQMLQRDQADAHFGMSVSGAGDVNGDGYSDVIIGARDYDDGSTDEGATFIYHGSTSGISTTVARMLAPTNQGAAYFGWSVSGAGDVNGDGYSDVIIGARNYQSGAAETDEGAIYIYHGSASGIGTSYARMIESDQASAYLGNTVASAGDVNGDGYSDIVVGASGYDNGQTDEGVAFVYHGSSSGIGTAYNTLLQADQASSQFGDSVATAGDVNGDGFSDVVVGAPDYDFGSTNEGRAFLYHGSASGVVTTAAATVESDQTGANLGTSVAGAGDVNGDGFSDIIVGATGYDNGQTDEGAAFIYHGAASGIGTASAVTLQADQEGALFGWSVASAGDVNGDGYGDVIVGARLYENGETDEGAAFIYHGSATGIGTTYARMLQSDQALAWFGYSVALAGDVNGDGYSDVIVGAYYYDNGQTDEGAAFVYHGSSAGIGTTHNTLLEADMANDNFGTSVAGAGDVNGDGYSDVIVGAPNYYNGQNAEGAIYIYHGSPSGISTTYARRIESNQVTANLGASVASAGDVNGDGYSDVIAGAPGYTNGQASEGVVYIYHGSATGIGATYARLLESNQASAAFGFSVSGAGDVNGDGYGDVVIGASYYDNGQADEGAVFIYHGSVTGIGTSAIRLEQNQEDMNFGYSVSGAGDVNGDGYSDVIVGAPRYDGGQANKGAIYIYHGSSSGIAGAYARRLDPLNQIGAAFGWSVSGAGDVNGDGYSDVIVGAYSYDNGQLQEGGAFVYHGNNGGALRMTGQQMKGVMPVSPQGKIGDSDLLDLSVFARSFMGRSKAKAIYEVKGHGAPFNYGFTRGSTWTDTTLAGATLTTSIDLSKALYHWRVRYQFMDGSMSRWFVFDRSAGVYTPDVRVLKGKGESCSAGSECGSGFCADSVCCNVACGGNDTTDCQACSATNGADENGTCKVLGSSYTCRGAVDVCDAAEVCNGVTPTCPEDAFAAPGTPCASDDLYCTGDETCTGGECGSEGNPCETDYFCDEDIDDCINERQVPCDTDNGNPANSHDIIANVTITYTTAGGWTSPADCLWTCNTDYAPEGGACINTKEVSCDTDNANPANSSDTLANVTITYTTAGGWTSPADCAWECDGGYEQDEHGFCNLIGGPCEDNPCAEEHKHVCADDGDGGYTCSCDPHYSDDGNGACVADTQIVACVNILPANAAWLLIDEYDGSGNLEQTWDGTGWAPSADTCPWGCADGFFLNGEATACVECLTDDHCDDNSVCTGAETCDTGSNTCVDGTPLVCVDDNACTDNSCDPATGCVVENNTDTCDDGSDLTENDTCDEGACNGTLMPGVCGNAIPVGTLPYTAFSETATRPNSLESYGAGCAAATQTTEDVVYELTVEEGVEYQIQVAPTDGGDLALNLLGICGEGEACIDAANTGGAGEAEYLTYTASQSGTVYIAVEGSGAYELSVAVVEQPDDDSIVTDEAMPDEPLVTDEMVTDETVTDETVADETVADETVTDETVTDETVTDETVTDTDTVKPDTVTDKDTEVTDNDETPDESADEEGDGFLPGDEDVLQPDSTAKPADDGCGCSLVF